MSRGAASAMGARFGRPRGIGRSFRERRSRDGVDSTFMRADGRRPDELRPVRITPDYNLYAEGSVLIECGSTRLICTASVEEKVPPFLEGQGKGWVTAEYGMPVSY